MPALQEAFALRASGTFALLGVKRHLKEKIADFNANLQQMKNLIEARDFGELQKLIDKIKQTAVDFDTTKPMAIVNAVKLEKQDASRKGETPRSAGRSEEARWMSFKQPPKSGRAIQISKTKRSPFSMLKTSRVETIG